MTGEAQDGRHPLCVECGKRPQPARHDGERGTHHRCDPCARRYLRRRDLRRRLLSGPWTFAAWTDPVRCVECAGDVPAGALYFRLGPVAAEDGERVCTSCMAGTGGLRAIAESVPQAPRLQSALLEHREHSGPVFVVVRSPSAVRVFAYLALSLAHGLADIGIQCGIVADDCAVRDLTIIVSGDADDAAAAQVLAACGRWLTQYASRVSVPAAHYRAIRTCVYERGGIGAVRRLVRQSIF